MKRRRKPEETDDRGEKDAEEEREFAEVFECCRRCGFSAAGPQQEPAAQASAA